MNNLRVDIIPPQPFRGKHDTTEHTPAEIRLIDVSAGEAILLTEVLDDDAVLASARDPSKEARNWKELADKKAHALRKALGLLKKFRLFCDIPDRAFGGPGRFDRADAEVWARSAPEAFETLLLSDKNRELIKQAKGFTLEEADG